jgi:hypothetical protein
MFKDQRSRLLVDFDPTTVESHACAIMISSFQPKRKMIADISKEKSMMGIFPANLQLLHDLSITKIQQVKVIFTISPGGKPLKNQEAVNHIQEVGSGFKKQF